MTSQTGSTTTNKNEKQASKGRRSFAVTKNEGDVGLLRIYQCMWCINISKMISFVTVLALVVITAQQPSCTVDAFQPRPVTNIMGAKSSNTKNTGTQLSMGKGLNKFKNKQADLKRKLELAKKQKKGTDNDDDEEEDESSTKALSDEEIKERNDRKRFEQLLKQEGGKVLSAYTSDSYLNTNQEEEEITAASKYFYCVL